MGMQWQAVLVRATDEEVRSVVTAAQQLVPCLVNPIDVSVLSLRTPAVAPPRVVLRMFAFRNRPVESARAPDCVAHAFQQQAFQVGLGRAIVEQVSRDPHVGLAVLASRFQGEATYLVARDALCCSGHIRFRSGMLVSGSVYGWEGCDELWTLAASGPSSRAIELGGPQEYNYYEPVATGLTQVLGPGADELFLSPTGAGTEGEWLRYQVLAKGRPVSPVVAVPDRG